MFMTLVALVVVPGVADIAGASFIAYDNGTGAPQQNFPNSLGLDFNVVHNVNLTSLGAFDNGIVTNLAGDDGTSGVTVQVYDRTTGLAYGPSVNFTPINYGAQINGDAFQSIPTLFLPTGFQGSIVASNVHNSNSSSNPNPFSTTDSGGGAISFVGHGRYGDAPLTYPIHPDGGVPNTYDAGTFQFDVAPQAAQAAFGVTGGSARTDFAGTLGYTFTLDHPVAIADLGYYVAGTTLKDNHQIAIFDLSGNQIGASVIVPAGSVQDGSHFAYAALASPIQLAAGTYVIGGSTGQQIPGSPGNFFSGPVNDPFLEGATAVTSFPQGVTFGAGRFNQDNSPTTGSTVEYPAFGQTANSYFGPNFEVALPEPTSVTLVGASLLGLLGRRRRA